MENIYPHTNQRIRAVKPDYMHDDRIEIWSAYFDEGEKKCFQAKIEWVGHPEGCHIQPMMQLTPAMAQMLMDSLWDCGVRPTAGAGSAGAMAATERHLADMQKLVFKGFDDE